MRLGVLAIPLLQATYKSDFLGLYIGGLMVREGNGAHLYDTGAILAREQQILSDLNGIRMYLRSPFYALALSPLTILPLWPAFVLEMSVFYAALLACWAWAARRFGPDSLIWSALYYPAAIGTAYGQDCVVVLVALILSYRSLEKGRLFRAGLLLGIALIKFHLIILFPLVLLMHRKWRVLAGLTISTCIALGLSFAVIGVKGIPAYIRILQDNSQDTSINSPQSMLNIYSIPANFDIESRAINAALALLIVGLTVTAAYRAPLWRWFSAAAVGSLLIVPHCYLYDGTFLLLPLWLVMFQSEMKSTRVAALILAMPFLYFFLISHPPYTVIPMLPVLIFLIALAWEGYRSMNARTGSGNVQLQYAAH